MVTLGLSVLLAASTIASGGSCTQPDLPATVRTEPMQMPSILHALDQHGTARLVVTLTPEAGAPADVHLSQSSGNTIIDAAALEVARQTQFAPETQGCVAVGGTYFYDFDY